MRVVNVRELHRKSNEVWKTLAREGEMVVARKGRPVAILAAVDESNLEGSLSAFRRARAVEAAASLQRRSVGQGAEGISMEEIDTEIMEVRRRRS